MPSVNMAESDSLGAAANQASAVRDQILLAAIGVIESGEEPSMRAVAKAAEIAERTLYRYFASREQLLAAVMPILRERASASMADDVDGLLDYIRRLFTTFDQNAGLARALATAAWAPMNITRPANYERCARSSMQGSPGRRKPIASPRRPRCACSIRR
jgi:AcrR family transcriptional regulator